MGYSINLYWNPKSFYFQFLVILLILVLLTRISCTIWYTTWFIGTSIVLICIAWKITKWIHRIYFHEILNSFNTAVLITGCDSGFGHRLANRLNAHGYTVYACCLNPNDAGPQQLLKTAVFPNATKLITMDVTKDSDVQRAYEEVLGSLEKDGKKLWAIVNNAGIGELAYVEFGKLENYQKVIDVNTIGMVRVTRTFLPLIRKSKGRIVNVASIAGRMTMEGSSAYSISKYGVVAFSTALRREMLPWGVKVSTIEPGPYKTPIIHEATMKYRITKTWSESSESIRNDYGQEYFDAQLNFLLEQAKGGRDNLDEVINAMLDAIAAVEPEIAYRVCGIDLSVLGFLFDYLPYSIADVISNIVMPKIKPKAA